MGHLSTRISRMQICGNITFPDSLLVAMVPKVITALRLTRTLLWVMSRHRGSKTPRPSRYALLLSYNRDRRVKWNIQHGKHGASWLLIMYQNTSHIKCAPEWKLSFWPHALPFSANVRIPLQALTTMSSSEELNKSTAVAGVLTSMCSATNWK